MTGKNTFIALLICIIAISGCKRASRLDSTLEECEKLAAQNPDSVMRVLDELQRTTASMDEHDQKRFLLTKLAIQNATKRPFMELDTIKASDAFGPGSSPGGHTRRKNAPRKVSTRSVFL